MRKNFVWIGITIYAILLASCFYFLTISRTSIEIFTPWQTINGAYIYCFAALTLVLGCLIFSGLSKRWLFLLFVLYSLLMHSYLPLTHDLIYGADGWRHIANEASFMTTGSFLHPVLSNGTTGSALQNFVGELSYWQLWILSVIVAKIATLSLIAVNAWLMPIVWGVTFPILLFYLGQEIFDDEKKSFALVWLSALPFALQVAGSFTLPDNLSFLVWLGSLIALFKWLKQPSKKLVYWLIGFGVILTMGYALFAVLFWLGLVITVLVRGKTMGLLRRPGALFAMTMVTGLVIPVLELIAHYDSFEQLPWLSNIKQLIGNFTSVYLADGPRSHTIAAGNILFNQVPSYAFVQNWFTADRWWIVLFVLMFFAVIVVGKLALWRRRNEPVAAWLLIFWTAMVLSYVFSWYFLAGQHLLARRLDSTLALLFIVLFMLGAEQLLDRVKNKKLTIILTGIVITIAIAASYSLGPNTDTVSADQYKVMQYVWDQEKNQSQYCVVADTYPLLALEALSNGKIIGGGFPIDANFNQPELTAALHHGCTPAVFTVTGARSCFFIGTAVSPVTMIGNIPIKEYTNYCF